MATVSVSTWEEFLEAVQVEGDTVECPENGVFDLTEEESITEPIEIYCAVINGNGTTIKNAVFNINGYCIQNHAALEINELHWDSIVADCYDSFWLYYSLFMEMNRCKISGEFIGHGYSSVTVFYGYSNFTSCAVNAVCTNGGLLLIGNNPSAGTSLYCRYQFFTSSQVSSPFMYALSPFNYCERCELYITAPNAVTLAFCLDSGTYKLSECVVRGTLGEASSAGYNCDCRDYRNYGTSLIASTLNANYHEPDELADWQRGAVCTDSQLRSVEYLTGLTGREAGNFPIGEFNDEWHTGDVTINGGYPYIPIMIDLPTIELHPVKQNPYITVWDIRTEQAELEYSNKNGLAILTPISCEVEENLNGAWTFSMQYPIDADGKWEYLQLRNLVKINGQYFTILNVQTVYDNNSGYIQCSGEHIFYQLADAWIFPGDIISGTTGENYLYAVNARTERYSTVLSSLVYYFYYHSDLKPSGIITKDVGEGCTPVDAILGSGGLIDQSGTGCAELCRDNFHYYVDYRMHGAQDNAFNIAVGRDLTGISRNFDTSQFVSYFRAYGDGGWWAVAWVLEGFLSRKFPHHIIRSKKFNVDVNEFYWENLINQGRAFFRRNCKPIIGYEIDLEDVRNNPDFAMVLNPWYELTETVPSDWLTNWQQYFQLVGGEYVPVSGSVAPTWSANTYYKGYFDRLKVGDQGTISDVRFGDPQQGYRLTVKISGTVYDAIKHKVTKITIGDQAHFSAPTASTVAIEPETVGGELWIQDADGAFILDANGEQIMQEVIVNG